MRLYTYEFRTSLADLFYLHVVQFYRCRTTEYLYRYFQFFLLVIHLFDHTIEIIEWSFNDLDRFTNNKRLTHAYATRFGHFIHFTQHLVHLGFAQSDRIFFPEEMNNVGCILDDIAKIIIQLTFCNFNHYITGIIVSFTHYFFTVLHFVYFFYRQKNLLDDLAPTTTGYFLVKVFFHFLLLTAHYTQHIPFGFLLLYIRM